MPNEKWTWTQRTCQVLLPFIVGLGGCAIQPRVAPAPPPPEKVARALEIANREWVRWGSSVAAIDRIPGATCLAVSDNTCLPVEPGCGKEQSTAYCGVVNEYWANAGLGPGRHECRFALDVCENKVPHGAVVKSDQPAWSAAFISAVLKEAGFSMTEFRSSARHWEYILAARDGQASSYELIPLPADVRPGDIVCAGREKSVLTPADVPNIPRGSEMHCDLVTSVDLSARVAEVIGGNVQQTVAKTFMPLDDQGRANYDPNSPRPWALVLRTYRF